jgi:hypothetical protein
LNPEHHRTGGGLAFLEAIQGSLSSEVLNSKIPMIDLVLGDFRDPTNSLKMTMV